ncbi:MAG: NADH-quinone oxidoreductase subunit G [Alphaproteobacteria bacterium]|nr:NADH-quinone oxidoreductase subunit G [Alphaproteobacteria bacterium]
MPKLKINDTEIEVAQGTSILQAAEMLGYEIPRFCYHDKLSVPANCRMCLVEVKGAPKPVASCAMAAGENMEVFTGTEMVHKARKGVMEFLLINHPLDCPICDQGGECDLQDQAVGYGYDRSRYYESKRAVKDKELGPLVKTVMTRCIQCTRCVRFADEIAGTPDLGLLNRGEDAEIGTLVEKMIGSELSGNLVDVCPVGALTNKPYAFKARSWELRKTETIDVHDAVGSNIRVDARGGEVMRVLPRLHEEINEEWTNDRSRYAIDGLKKGRLDTPYVRNAKTGKLEKASWEKALETIAVKIAQTDKNKIAALAGDLCDVESVVALKDILDNLGTPHRDCRIDGAHFDASTRSGYIFNTGIANIEQADCILLVGTNPRVEATLVNARIRKTWLEKRLPVGLIGEPADLTYKHTYIGVGPDSLQALASGQHSFAEKIKNAKNPVMIVGMGVFQRADGLALHAQLHDFAEKMGFVKDGWNGFNILHTEAGRVGALDVGFTPATNGMDFAHIVEGTENGKVDVLFLLNADFARALGDNAFVIYQGHHGDSSAAHADVILPGAAYTEKEATYVNMEGRAQIAKRAVYAPGEAREDWKILRALSTALGKPLPYDDLGTLRQRIAKEFPHIASPDVRVVAPWKQFGQAGAVKMEPFHNAVRNFYKTNVITKASAVMTACVEKFLSKNDERKAA